MVLKVVEKLERKCKERAGKLNAHFQVPNDVVRHQESPDIEDLEARLRRAEQAEQELMARDEIRERGQSDQRAGKLHAHFQDPHAVVRHQGSPDIADLEARLRRAEQDLMTRDEIREGGQSDKEKVIYLYGPHLHCTSTINSVLWQFKYILVK